MDVTNEILRVSPSASSEYDIFFKNDWQGPLLNDLLSKYSRIFVITQKNIRRLYFDNLEKNLSISIPQNQVLEIEDGETAKHISNLLRVYNDLIKAQLDRHSCIVALGGGVVGDFAGFVAATILRGVHFAQFPTTLLASVDSSVGGKVAVNVDQGKNMVGSFYQPDFVYCNLSVLHTLENREWYCGLAEMCKHAFLDHTGELFSGIKKNQMDMKNPDSDGLKKAIFDSASFKAKIVEQDEKEKGLRAILNLGHTTAHALESLTGYSSFSHGEAVSRGLVTALLLSEYLYQVDANKIEQYIKLMLDLNLPCDTFGFSAEEIQHHMQFDKKSSSGSPRFVLINNDFKPVINQQINQDDFTKIWMMQKDRFG